MQQATGGTARLTVCDIADDEQVRARATATSDMLGDAGFDVLVSDAGILTRGPREVLSLDAISHEFEVNVFGSLAAINAFLPALRKVEDGSSKWGR